MVPHDFITHYDTLLFGASSVFLDLYQLHRQHPRNVGDEIRR